MAFSQEFIERVLEANNIVEIVSQYTQLKPQSGGFMGRCPFPDHQEKTPSFSVSEGKQVYNCFGCHKKGNLLTFLRDHSGMGFREAIEYLADRAHISLPRENDSPQIDEAQKAKKRIFEANRLAAQMYFNNLQRLPPSHVVWNYVKHRGLSPSTIETFKIGCAGEDWNQLVEYFKEKKVALDLALEAKLIKEKSSQKSFFDLFRDRLMFPIQNLQGDFLGFGGRVISKGEPKYLNSSETPVFHKGKILYGLYQTVKFIRSKDEAIIVEGYMDLVSLFQSGIQNVAATLGTALTESHARALKKITQNVVVLFDGDQAGQEAAKRSLPILLAAGLRPRGLILPNELDPDEFVKQEGADSLLELVKNSKDLFNLVLSHWLIGYTGQVSQKLKLIDLLAPIFQQIPDANTKSLYLQEVAVALAVEKTWITNALKNMSEGRKPQENQDLGAKNVPAVSQINTVKTSGFVDPIKEKRPMQYKYQLKTIPKAELTLIKLVLSNSEYFNEAFQEGVERFLQDSTSKEIFSRALEVSRQTPEKFDTLVSLLTTYLDPTDTLVPDGTSGTGESEQKLLRDCIVKVKDDFLSKELKSLSLEVAANPHPEKLEKILQLKKEKLALRQ